MTHTLEITNSEIFKAIKDGRKSFLLIKDDRNYVAGDTIAFQILSDREEVVMAIDYLEVEVPGLKKDFILLAIKAKESGY